MAFEAIDIVRYIFYVLDFIFGVLSWGITADKLKVGKTCALNDFGLDVDVGSIPLSQLAEAARSKGAAPCNAVIALGVITMIFLLIIVVLRTLDLIGTISFPELIETISFRVMTLIWFFLAIVTVAVTESAIRDFFSDVKIAIAGAWIAFFTHTASTVISVLAHRQAPKE